MMGIRDAMRMGEWILIENLHLFLNSLDTFWQGFQDLVQQYKNEKFRIWITCQADTQIPLYFI